MTIRNFLILLLPALLLFGCADMGYYLHSIKGHSSIVNKTRDIDVVLEDEATPEKLAHRLELVKSIRKYAIEQIHLPESDSYTLYADLKRGYALKNLFAASEFSVTAHRWCYPIVGCAGYRGYFDESRLHDYSEKLLEQGFDIYVANVAAYSTLGWFDDPVLNTFIYWPEELLAGLMFHELAHQQVYIKGDSSFNESFAMALQHLAVEQWLSSHGKNEQLARYQQRQINRQQVIQLILKTRESLQKLYASDIAIDEKRKLKQQQFQLLREDYEKLSSSFAVPDGFKRWFSGELNNARLVSISTYYSLIPAFTRLFEISQGDFKLFLARVNKISTLDSESRGQCLNHWLEMDSFELKQYLDTTEHKAVSQICP